MTHSNESWKRQDPEQTRLDLERVSEIRDHYHGTLKMQHLPTRSLSGMTWEEANPRNWILQDVFPRTHRSVRDGWKAQLEEARKAGLVGRLRSGTLVEYLRSLGGPEKLSSYLAHGIPKIERWFELYDSGESGSSEALWLLSEIYVIDRDYQAIASEQDKQEESEEHVVAHGCKRLFDELSPRKQAGAMGRFVQAFGKRFPVKPPQCPYSAEVRDALEKESNMTLTDSTRQRLIALLRSGGILS